MVCFSRFSIEAAVAVAIPLLGSMAGSYVTKKNIPTWYDKSLVKPNWRPPNWVFGPVWTALYSSMGYASYLVWKDGQGFEGKAFVPLMTYGAQLSLNFAWSFIFFGQKKIDWALVDIVLLDIGIAATIYQFSKINTTASYMLYPYLGWCLFATFLNKWIYDHNKKDQSAE